MKTEQCEWTATASWGARAPGELSNAQLVLLFGSVDILKTEEQLDELRKAYPGAYFMGCSTAGEIRDTHVSDDTLVTTAVEFDHTRVIGKRSSLSESRDSRGVGEELSAALDSEGLVHVFVLSDGLSVNGSELVKGLMTNLPSDVTVTGGLSGDGGRFEETLVIPNGAPAQDTVAVVGFYGDRLRIGCGSLGGWDSFGPERLVTRAKGNVLFELDGKSALELYKKYLGEHAAGLPATGLLFPLSVREGDGGSGLVRTILSVSEEDQSLTFAGDIPEGSFARLMKANFDRLVDGASGAARVSHEAVGSASPDLAVLISCVGRKMVLKQRIEEEVEAVRDVLGDQTVLTGFYSYGEISPFTPNAKCELHNQTMTITTFSEV